MVNGGFLIYQLGLQEPGSGASALFTNTCSDSIATLSVASTDTDIPPSVTPPLGGSVTSVTVGGILSVGVVVTSIGTGSDTDVLPSLSVTSAIKLCWPKDAERRSPLIIESWK